MGFCCSLQCVETGTLCAWLISLLYRSAIGCKSGGTLGVTVTALIPTVSTRALVWADFIKATALVVAPLLAIDHCWACFLSKPISFSNNTAWESTLCFMHRLWFGFPQMKSSLLKKRALLLWYTCKKKGGISSQPCALYSKTRIHEEAQRAMHYIFSWLSELAVTVYQTFILDHHFLDVMIPTEYSDLFVNIFYASMWLVWLVTQWIVGVLFNACVTYDNHSFGCRNVTLSNALSKYSPPSNHLLSNVLRRLSANAEYNNSHFCPWCHSLITL